MENDLLVTDNLPHLLAKEIELGSGLSATVVSDFSIGHLELPQISE